MSVWDSPGMNVGGDYVKFDQIGDNIAGIIVEVTVKRWDDGTISPQLLLDTPDGVKTVTAGQIRLKAALAEQRPEKGDYISIRLSDIERRSGGKTLKHFDVQVQRANATPAAPTARGGVMDIEAAKRLLGVQ